MDKKTKKRVAVLRARLQNLEKMRAGSKAQPDDPQEQETLRQQIAAVRNELAALLA